MAEKDINEGKKCAIDVDGCGAATTIVPERLTVVAVKANNCAVSFGCLHRFEGDCGCSLRERAEDAAGVKAANALGAEDEIPINSAGLQLRDRSMAAVHHAERSTDAKASLKKVGAVSGTTTNAVVWCPAKIAEIDTALKHEVLDQAADRIVDQAGDDGGTQIEAAAKAAGNVVFAAALPNVEIACARYAVVTRVEAEHDLAEAEKVPAGL